MKLKIFYITLIASILVTSYAVGKLQSNHREIMLHRDKYRAASKVRETFLLMQTNFRGDALYTSPEFKKAHLKNYVVITSTLNGLSELGKKDKDTGLIKDVEKARTYVLQWQRKTLQCYAKKPRFKDNYAYIRYLNSLRPGSEKLRDGIEISTSRIRENQKKITDGLMQSTKHYEKYLLYLIAIGSFASLTAAFSVGTSLNKAHQDLKVSESVLIDKINESKN